MKLQDKGLLKMAAESIGSVAGTVAASVGIGHHGEPVATHSQAGKLPKKTKSRLPRKEKKALAKKSAAKSRG